MTILIVTADFYGDIADMLEAGAIAALKTTEMPYQIKRVPGALEIPPAISIAVQRTSRYSGFIALGCVIRGETSHYDTVCAESARGLMDLGVHHHLAIGNGIITVENREQALHRADPKSRNKGYDAAKACLRLIELKQFFSQ